MSDGVVDGGYDVGYAACPCFWGREPGSLIRRLEQIVGSFAGLHVLDVGCGEGKNSAYLAARGARVRAVELSMAALINARTAWPSLPNLSWERGDVRALEFPDETYDLVVAYGLLHCLSGADEIIGVIRKLQRATQPGGYHVVCAFNQRHQELAAAHPGFAPCLLGHCDYVQLYRDWEMAFATDEDLVETHPHNGIEHRHSMTRLLARRPDRGPDPTD